jgi:hypothetical protein
MTTSAESTRGPTADHEAVGPSESTGPLEVGEVVGLLHALPKEVGVILLSAGLLGFVLPGPGTPALIAGGLILWPDRFGKVEGWFRRRFPDLHRTGIGHVGRFLSDLERRYPGSTR